MEIDDLVQEIMEAFESEPETDYGDPITNQHIRNRGIEAHIRDLVEDYEKDLEIVAESEELAEKDGQIDELEDEILELKDEKIELNVEIDVLKSRLNMMISEAA